MHPRQLGDARAGALDVLTLRGWAAHLDDAEFGRALAALGALVAASRTRSALAASFARSDPRRRITRILAPSGVGGARVIVSWAIEPLLDRSGRPDLDLLGGTRPEDLALAWANARALLPPWEQANVRIEIRAGRLTLGSYRWLAEAMSIAAVADSAYVADPRLGTGDEFRWPVRIGFLDDETSRELGRQLGERLGNQGLADLVEITEPRGPDDPCEVLVIPDALGEAVTRLGRVPHGITASALVTLGGLGDAAEVTVDGIRRALEGPLEPWVLGAVDVGPGQRAAWLERFVEELSHDQTVDVALTLADRPYGGHPLILGDPDTLARMRVRDVAVRAVQALPMAEPGDLVNVGAEVAASLEAGAGLGGAVLISGALATPLIRRLALLATVGDVRMYRHESDGAMTAAAIGRAVARFPEPRRAATRARRPAREQRRWIQARVLGSATRGEAQPVESALEPRARLSVLVRIGPADATWLAATRAFPGEISRDGKRHRLRVVFEPGAGAAPTVRGLLLPPEGPSTTCRFSFTAPASGTVRARIIVLYRNRVLQTAILTASVAGPGAARGRRAGAPRLAIESVIRPAIDDLVNRQAFDLAVVHNHDADGTSGATAMSGAWAKRIPMSKVETDVRAIQDTLSLVAQSPSDYRTLDAPATVDLLWDLALRGVDLRNGLFGDSLPPGLAKGNPVPRIQVVAADPNAFLPIEFLYDFPPPSAPTLCKNAATALRDGHCDPGQFHEPVAADRSIPVVCPVGFWSMNRVIERHLTTDPWIKRLAGYDFGLRSDAETGRDQLGGITTSLYAASDRVVEPEYSQVADALLGAAAAPGGAVRVTSWTDWVADVGGRSPDMLVLLAHTDKIARQTALEIGGNPGIPSGRLNDTYVRVKDAGEARRAERKPGPLVFLLGCDTALPWLEYQTFVVRFRNYGASIVVGTVATVPASHAANVAIHLVDELKGQVGGGAGGGQGPKAFGDVLLAARRRILADGEVMALCVTSYGDADWRF